ncbi:PepSY domain-containing protein [Paludibacterium sp. B53371]|uniref:PepSY domain-containing protein n=1 Tax=Paludibacterium sp. B53371 TaxID=2806263 RepID=UPI001C04B0F3|nr:PepSY domain-containing protein [Paludibacterium sp. B53371]
MKWSSFAGMMLLPGLLLPLPCRADTEQDVARKAVQAGEILPLEKVMKVVQQAFPGAVLEVELDRQEQLWVYEIKLLQDNGVVRKVRYNARTATLIDSRTKPQRAGKRHGHPYAPGEGA